MRAVKGRISEGWEIWVGRRGRKRGKEGGVVTILGFPPRGGRHLAEQDNILPRETNSCHLNPHILQLVLHS